MGEFSQYLTQARKDIDSCLSTWKNIFEENYGDKIEYIYTKGSAIKQWDSLIDYVPILSDVDIHYKVYDDSPLFEDLTDAFISSLGISQLYEDTFVEQNPDNLHVPRTQLINVKDLESNIEVVFPKQESVKILFGHYPDHEMKSIDFLRRVDRLRLIEEEDFLILLPKSVIDSTGIDLWTRIRRMVWRVSPSPVRLLSQKYEDPIDLWDLNRTKIVKLLEEYNYQQIADNYQDYYYEGWLAFLNNFEHSDSLRRIISLGFEIIKDCINEVKKIEN